MKNVCPECKQGKHPNCTGGAWDDEKDKPAVCDCYAQGHPEQNSEGDL